MLPFSFMTVQNMVIAAVTSPTSSVTPAVNILAVPDITKLLAEPKRGGVRLELRRAE